MASTGFPIVLVNGAPTVQETAPQTVISTDPTVNADHYRTITMYDMLVETTAPVAQSQSLYELSVPSAEVLMTTRFGSLDGVLMAVTAGVPSLKATGQDGFPVVMVAGVPTVGTVSCSGESAGPDGVRLWLERTFGKR